MSVFYNTKSGTSELHDYVNGFFIAGMWHCCILRNYVNKNNLPIENYIIIDVKVLKSNILTKFLWIVDKWQLFS